jgi:hypothetical protein
MAKSGPVASVSKGGSAKPKSTVRSLSSLVEEAFRTPGKPLDAALRAEMQARFGHDFSRVRVHRDVEATASLNAQAFAIGEHVFFAPGAWSPATYAGRDLLAHELAHTIQHGPVSHDARWTVSRSADPLEREADHAARWALRGRGAMLPIASGRAAPGLISRREATTEVAPEGPKEALDSRAAAIAAQLRADPDDKTGRVRRQLNRLQDKTRDDLLDLIRNRVTAAQWQRLQQVLSESLPSETEVDTVTAPAPELTMEHPAESPVEAPPTAPEGPLPTDAKAGSKPEEKPQKSPQQKSPQEVLEQDPGPEGAPKKAPVDTQHAEEEAKKKGPQPPTIAPAAKAPAATGGSAVAAPSSAEAASAPAATEGAAQTGAAPGEASPAAVPGEEAGPAAGAGEAKAATGEAAPAATGEAGPAGTGEAPESAESGAEVPPAPGGEAAPPGGAPQATGTAEAEQSTEPATSIEAGGPAPDQAAGTVSESPEVAAIPDPASEEKEPATNQSVPDLPPETSPADSLAALTAGAAVPSAAAAPPAATASAPDMAAGGMAPEASAASGAPKPAAMGGGGAALPAPGAAPEEAPGMEGPEMEGPEEMPPAMEAEVTGPEPAPPPPTPEGQGAPQPGGCEGGGGGAPGAEGEGGGGGPCGGGGGGGGAEDKPPEAAPDVSQSDPPAAMGAVANLPPAQLQAALGGVTSAASNAVKQQKDELKANPPSMDRPSGVPAQRDPSLPVTPPALPPANDPAAVQRAAAGAPQPVPQPDPLPAPPAPPTQGLKGPQLPGDAQMTEADTARAKAAVENLPTTDPALNVTAGDPPKLQLAGDADPKQTQEQQANLGKSTDAAHQQGQQDVSAPMGENNIYPTVPAEKLEAKTDGEGGPGVLGSLAACAKGGSKGLAKAQAAGGAGGADEAVSIVAKEQKGDEIKAAAGQAQGEMQARQDENAEKIADEKSKSQKEIDDAIQENAGAQKDERSAARKESIKVRGEWNKEQATLVGDAQKDSDKATTEAYKQIGDQRKTADGDAAASIADGNKQAADVRRDAETQAENKKKDAKKESGGFFSWLSSKVTSFFNKIKEGIQAVFEAARKKLKEAIEAVKKAAVGLIEKARKFVVDAIKKAGDVLIAIGDTVLAGFPNLRDKFRKAVKDRVDKAVDTVNKYAEDLKKGVQKLLDAIGSVINGLLGLLECAFMAAVDHVASVVQGAIDAAKAFVDALAVFGVLIKDISANPGQWLSNLGRAVVDGIKNCLWTAFKSAVKNWFNQKLEEVLGLGLAIWNLLFKGCMKLKDIAKMAWEGLISAIPMILIQLLIEKLVSMIVPAAGAILTIIEGLRAAWGTVSRIIAAIALFIAFLKAVKSGSAAGPFATALAAAGIVLIDFVANWLLQRLRKPAGAISGRLKAFAQKIGNALKKGFAAVKKGAKAAVGAIRRGAAAVGRAIKSGIKAVGRGLKKVGKAIAKTKIFKAIAKSKIGRAIVKAGQAIKKVYGKGKQAYQDAKAKLKAKWEKWKQEREKRKKERRARAEAETRSAIEKMLSRGANGIVFWARLMYLRARWGWKSLSLQKQGTDSFAVIGELSPAAPVIAGIIPSLTISSMTPVHVKGGTSRLIVYDKPVLPEAQKQFFGQVQAKQFARLGEQAGVSTKASFEFEKGAMGLTKQTIAPHWTSVEAKPVLPTEWTAKRKTTFLQKLRALGQRLKPGQKKPAFSVEPEFMMQEEQGGMVTKLGMEEATLQANFRAVESFGLARKEIQLAGFLSAMKLEIARLEKEKRIDPKAVEIHIYYHSDRKPDEGPILTQLRTANLPNVSIHWTPI